MAASCNDGIVNGAGVFSKKGKNCHGQWGEGVFSKKGDGGIASSVGYSQKKGVDGNVWNAVFIFVFYFPVLV